MDSKKKKKLEAKGWITGDASDFLGLSPEEARFIDLKLALKDSLKAERLKQNITQVELAKMNTGQVLEVVLDDGAPVRNVPRSIQNEGHELVTKDQLADGNWSVVIRKG